MTDENALKKMEKIKEIEDLCNFLVSNKTSFPEFNSNKKGVEMLYKKAYNILMNNKNKRSLTQKKITAIDNLLISLIYIRELMLLYKNNPKIIDNYSRLIEKFIDYPKLISKNNKISLRHISEGVDRLIVLLTHSCQLRCKYCSVRKFDAEMNEPTLKKAINLLFTSKKNTVQLQFFGGEPLLRFNLLKKGVDYAERLSNKTGKKIKFLLTTNGIALTNEKIDYLIKHDFTIELSLDGDIETQLKFRKSVLGINYYDVVIENLLNLIKKNADYFIISVVTPSNVQNLFKNFKYFINKGFTKLQINYALGYFWEKEESKILFEQLLESLNFMKKHNNIILINSLKNRKEPVVLNAEITVDCDGTLYLETGICLEEDFNKLKQDFKIGDLNTIKNINCIFATRSRNLKKLVDVYSKEKNEFRKTILNNIEMGMKVQRLLKSNLLTVKKVKTKSEFYPQEIRDKINYLKFMACKLLSDDLYPPMSFGRKLNEKKIMDGWRKTSEMVTLGKAPKKLGIYVHIPYCVTKCKFCFCGSIMLPKNSEELDSYLDFLEAQINKFANVLNNNLVTSLYVGGGTPSILTSKQLIRFFNMIYKKFDFEKNSAVIFEATPLTLTREKLRILKEFGKVTRITIGIQSLNEEILKTMGRLQTDTFVKNAIRYAKEFIPFVNCDYVVNLPGQTKKIIKEDLIKLTSYAPDSVHLNSFKPLSQTIFVEQTQIDIENKNESKEKIFMFAEKILDGRGYINRDGSYTKFDIEPVDNAQELDLRRQNSSLLGIGYLAGSHSYGNYHYVYYPCKPKGHMARIKKMSNKEFSYFGIDNDFDEEMRRFMINNLRQDMSIKGFIKLFGKDPRVYFKKEFIFLKKIGKLDIKRDIINFKIKSDKENQVLTKLFFSEKIMDAFNKKCFSEYDKNFDYNNILKNYILNCD